MKKNVYISVSTDPVTSFQNIVDYAKELQGITDFIHCDIMDGKFVPTITYDSSLVNNINQNTLTMLDVHLMCNEPLKIIDEGSKCPSRYFHKSRHKDKRNKGIFT